MVRKLALLIVDYLYFLFYKPGSFINIKLMVLASMWKGKSLQHIGKNSILNKGVEIIGGENISIGNHVHVGKYSSISTWKSFSGRQYSPQIKIGDYTSIGAFAHFSAINNIEIGRHVLMGKFVTIVDNFHGDTDAHNLQIPPSSRELYSKGSVVIGDNVWIADKVSIVSGVKIGTGAVIGSNSVVTKNVPPYSVVGGVPSKIIKQLPDIQGNDS
jgi:acetyltransferase-like isoleucine patch superfamily enzyme